MKTRNIKHLLGLGLIIIATSFLGACADGDLNLEQPEPPVPQLAEIGMFQACKAGLPETCADTLTIETGESVELIWETAGATSVEIASADGAFVASPLEASGSVIVEAVSAGMRFTLSAMTADGVSQKDVAIEVASRNVDVTAALTSSKARVLEGETVDLCWTVTPLDAAITIVGDDSVTYFPAEGIEARDACITVMPAKATVYTLTAKSGDEPEVQATASVEVDKKITVSITTTEVTAENKVTLKWETSAVDPDSISIDPDVGDVKSLTVDGKGEKEITVTENTTYTITVTAGDQPAATDSVDIVMPEREIDLEISINDIPVAASTPETELPAGESMSLAPKAASSDAPAEKQPVVVNAGTYFENEDVKLSWNASVDGIADKITTVKLLDSYGAVVKEDLLAAGSHTITVAGDGQYTLALSGTGIKEATATISVNVRKWVEAATTDEKIAGRDITAIVPYRSDQNKVLAGVSGDMSGGKIKLIRATAGSDMLQNELLDIGFKGLYEGGGSEGGKIPELTGKFHTYPINTIVVDDQARLFAGTSGGIVFSKDDGATWELFAKGTLRQNKDYPGSHVSCKGRTQEGKKDGEIASLEQICDIIIEDDGRFIAATDHKVVYLKYGVDEYLKAKTEMATLCPAGEVSDDDCSKLLIEKGLMDKFFGGMPAKGKPGNAVYGVANFDIELAKFDGEKVLFSATSRGLFESKDLGQNWTQIAASGALAESQPVYAVSVDTVSKTIFVGTDGGIYYKSYVGGEWAKAEAALVAATPPPVEETTEGEEGNGDGIVTVDGSSDDTVAPDEANRVFSIAIDPVQAGSIYAASGAGVLVSRDGGKTFKNIKANKILSIVSKSDASGTVGIYAATAKGMAVSLAKPVITPVAAEKPAETPPAEQPVTPPTEEIPTVGDESPTDEVPIVTPITAMTASF